MTGADQLMSRGARMPAEPLVVFSAPCNTQIYKSSVVHAGAVRTTQMLFGSEARLSVAIKVFGRAGAHCVFCPAPEIFSSDVSFEALRRSARERCGQGDGPIIHVRLGLIGEARVLKRAANCLFVAESRRRNVLTLGQNVLPEGRVVPDAFRTVMHDGSFDRDLRRARGERLDFRQLPPAFSCADIADPAAGQLRLLIQPFEEFGRATWPSATVTAAPEGADRIAPPGGIATIAARGPADRPFIALPFDVADPVSLIPDLVRTYALFPGLDELGVRLMLMPFNDVGRDAALHSVISEIRDLCRRVGRDSAIRNDLFVARLLSSEHCATFAQCVPVALVDESGPEAQWTAKRLRTLGVAIVALADPDDPAAIVPDRDGEADIHPIALDEERRVRILDAHGERIYAVKGASRRAIVAAFETAASLARRSTVAAATARTADEAWAGGRSVRALLREIETKWFPA